MQEMHGFFCSVPALGIPDPQAVSALEEMHALPILYPVFFRGSSPARCRECQDEQWLDNDSHACPISKDRSVV